MRSDSKKAPIADVIGAFFLFCLSVFASAQDGVEGVDIACSQLSHWPATTRQRTEPVVVEQVYDGDTVRLRDGRKVRLLGVNTPELPRQRGGQRQPGQALAKEALAAVEQWLPDHGRVLMLVGKQGKDRYGRQLAYLFSMQGQSLSAMLLARGLAFALVIPPDRYHAPCYARIEGQARAQRLGVWGVEEWQPLAAAAVVAAGKTGFQRVEGVITKVGRSRHAVWVELDNVLVLRVFIRGLAVGQLEALAASFTRGDSLVVRGWVVKRSLSAKELVKGYRPWLLDVPDLFAIEAGFIDKNDRFGLEGDR